MRSVATNESKDNVWYLYIVECANSELYIGVSTDVDKRIYEHKIGHGAKFTRTFRANKLLYTEKFLNKDEAYRREKQLKGWTRKKKFALMSSDLELLKKA